MKGKHLIINAISTDKKFFASITTVYNLLENLRKKLSFKKLTHPHIIKGTDHKPGITGFLVIESSHISIHTFENDKFIALDIYSCEWFDHKLILEFLKKEFKNKNFNYSIIDR